MRVNAAYGIGCLNFCLTKKTGWPTKAFSETSIQFSEVNGYFPASHVSIAYILL